jgi:hypothetical protein
MAGPWLLLHAGGTIAIAAGWGAMGLEVLRPGFIHRVRICGVLLIHLFEQPVIGTKVGFCGRAGR